MEALKSFLRDYHFVVSAVLGGVVSYIVMGWFYRGNTAPPQADSQNNEVFTHSRRTRIFLYTLAGLCALMAALPLYALRYSDQWTPKLLLILGFSCGAIYLALEVRRTLVIVRPQGLAVRGAFSALREVSWNEMSELRNYDSLQMLCLTTSRGRVWISYMLTSFGLLLRRLNQHGLALKLQRPMLDDMSKALLQTETLPQLAWFMLPFLSIWKIGSRHAAVFAKFNDNGPDGYYVHYTIGTVKQAVEELVVLLRNHDVMEDHQLADGLADDLGELLKDQHNWPV